MDTVQTIAIIKKIVSFSPRQFAGEAKTRNFILSYFQKNNVPFRLQNFTVPHPKPTHVQLIAGGKPVHALSCALKSGTFSGNEYLQNPMYDDWPTPHPVISVNPICDSISLHSFYFAPAVAIHRKDVAKILAAKSVRGSVTVKKVIHPSANILVGNIKNAKHIIFTHFDSHETGAVDNASGTAVVMQTVRDERLRRHNLFVLSGCEELSFDNPLYWGFGYRVFERAYPRLMRACKKIITIDSVGNGPTTLYDWRKLDIVQLGCPLRYLEKFKKKTVMLSGDLHDLMTVYHSAADDMTHIKPYFLHEATRRFHRMIQ